ADRSSQETARGRPSQAQIGIHGGADAFRIAHANPSRLRLQTVYHFIAQPYKTGETDISATGLGCELLDVGPIAVKQDDAVGFLDPVGQAAEIERRISQLHAAIHLGLAECSSHSRINRGYSRCPDITVEAIEDGELNFSG